MRIKIFSSIVLSLLLVTCGIRNPKESTSDPNLPVNGKWSILPVPIYIANEFVQNGKMKTDIFEAGAFWQRAAGIPVFKFLTNWEGPTPPFSGTYENPTDILTNFIFFVRPWTFDPMIKGTTILTVRDGEFENALVYLNRENYCFGQCAGGMQISFQRLVAHELGHVLGLKHTPNERDIMYPNIPAGRSLFEATFDQSALHYLTVETP